jgi:hypothetical protein
MRGLNLKVKFRVVQELAWYETMAAALPHQSPWEGV